MSLECSSIEGEFTNKLVSLAHLPKTFYKIKLE